MIVFFKKLFLSKSIKKVPNDIEELEDKKRKLEVIFKNLLETEKELKNIKINNQEKRS